MSLKKLLYLIVIFPCLAYGQDSPLNYSVEFKGAGSTGGQLPFWLSANRWGEVDPAGPNAILNAQAAKTLLGSSEHWSIDLGAELTSRYSKNSALFFKQLYTRISYKALVLEAGRFRDITGNVFEPLSMGSMSFSGNATPLPKIKLGLPEYYPLPYTKGYVEIKGAWSHGWMEAGRYTSRALLHEKYGYIRLGGDLPVNLVGGLNHYAFLGGNSRRYGPLPRSLNDYLNVAFALGEGGEDAPPTDQAYFLGDHKGYWDLGAQADFKSFKVKLYKQFILEDKDNVKFRSPQDGLYGLALSNKKSNPLLEAVIWEFLYTKWQNGPIGPGRARGGYGGRDNYYNHSVYRSGWTYFGRTIGTPLLFPQAEGLGIANNRLVAHHVGAMGQLGAHNAYKFIATYSRNYGTYKNPFESRLDAWSFLLSTETDLQAFDNVSLGTAVAVDMGDLYDQNLGFMVTLKWSNSR